MNRRRAALTLCVILTAVFAGSSARGQGVAGLPPGFVMGEDGALPPALDLSAAQSPLAFPNHPGWPVPVQGGASPPVCADIDPA